MKGYSLICLFTNMLLCLNFPLLAQEEVPDTLLGEKYFEKIDYWNLDNTFFYAEKALFHLQGSNDWEKITDCYHVMALHKYYNSNFSESRDYTKKLLELSSKHFEESSRTYTDGILLMGFNYSAVGNYYQAIKSYEKCIKLHKKGKLNKKLLSGYYQNLALEYRELGEYTSSLNCMKNALRFNPEDLSVAFLDIGKTYLKKKDLLNAKHYFQKSLALLTNSFNQYDTQKKLDCYQGLSEVYLQEEHLDSAKHCIDSLFAISNQFERNFMNDHYHFIVLGKYSAVLNELEKAELAYNEAIKFTKETKYKDFQKHHEIALMFTKKAEFTHQYKTPKEALPLYQEALIQNAREFNNEDWQANPKVEQFQNKSYALEALVGKSAVLFDLFKEEKNNLGYLEQALVSCQLTSELIFELRKEYRAEGSKLFLSEKVIPFYENAIAIALALYEETDDEAYKSTAFQFAEANKSLLLLESIRKHEATKTTGIPDTLIDKEQELKFQIAFYQKTIAEEKQKKEGKVSADLSEMETTLFDLEEQYQGLIDTLKQMYPAFEQQSEELNLATVASVQQELDGRKSGVLEMFVGKESIYVFLVHRGGVETLQVNNKMAIQGAVEKLLGIINSAPKSQSFEKDFKIFEKEASYLYQELLSPIFSKMSSNPSQLTIIPDGFLSFLPFEILLSTQSKTGEIGYELDNLDYLFESCLIHYNYSASLLAGKERLKKVDNNLNFTGFAPSFDTKQIAESRACIQNELYSLRCNQAEVQDISTLWGGESFYAEGASKESFLGSIKQSDILHLATHVCMNVNEPKASKIFFTDGYLTPFDLTNLELNNELTVLSACNTGSGKLLGGEGVLSLAREFTLAGSRSTLTSLWAIDDCSTSEMMNYYYKNLINFQTKDKALREAKITFLQNADKERAHPYYWAAFLQFGEVESLGVAPFSMWWLVGMLGLVVLGLLIWKRKKEAVADSF